MNKNLSNTVSSALINYRLQIAERLNGNRQRILELAGITESRIANDTGRITHEEERRLWKAMVKDTGREDIGLKCGLRFPIQSMAMIGYVMMNASSIKKALEHFCKYQLLVGDSMGMRVEEKLDYTTIYIDLWSPWHEELRFTTDVFSAATFSWIRKSTTNQPHPLRVGFHYRRPSNRHDYEKIYKPAPVEFGCDTSFLTYHSSDLQVPIISANNELFDYFHDQLKTLYNTYKGKNTITWKVKQLILEQLLGETPEIEKVASQLLMSIRSLQKSLKDEGTTYRKLLQEVKKDVACDHLNKGELSVSEIAYLLGYSEISAFSRSFKKWTGVTPTDFQKT